MTKCTPEEIQELIGLYEDALADDLNYYEDKCETPIELSVNMMEAVQDCMEELEDKLITLLFEGRRAYKKKFEKKRRPLMKTKYTVEDIKALIEVMEDDLFDDLLNHVSHAQTASDIVDGMEESIWAQGDKLSEKLILLLFPGEKGEST